MNADYDAYLDSVTPGSVITADDLADRSVPGGANVFRYGIQKGYLEQVLGRATSRRSPEHGARLRIYRRTVLSVAVAASERECGWCGAAFERHTMPSGQRESWTRFQRRSHCSRECQEAERDASALALRTVVARTCVSCGAFKDGRHFRRSGTGTDSTCTTCRSARYRSTVAAEVLQQRSRDKISNRVGVLTYTGAARNGFQWTGPEIELLARDDLTVRQIAEMVQRTPYAVQEMRRLLRKGEPKVALLLNGPR